jgi:predicted aminopeptidase
MNDDAQAAAGGTLASPVAIHDSRVTSDPLRRTGRRSRLAGHWSRRVAAVLVLLLVGGCANVGYYWQSIGGQLEIWSKQRAIEDMLADRDTPEALRARLGRVLEIRDFATRELALPDNGSYRSYADIGRPFVVWNVVAVPEFSIEPRQWCFLFAGCVSYRGYFSIGDAKHYASTLANGGFDVYVGGVAAYSTLGYFDDPVLSTFVHYPEAELARLIFHELAHQVVFVSGDTVFNESFAVAVEIEGVRRWLALTGDGAQQAAFDRKQRIREEFAGLIAGYRERFATLYRTPIAPEAMRARKAGLFEELERDYAALRESWGGYPAHDGWFARRLNNAHLASIAIYTQKVPAFQALLAREGGDLARFYGAVKALADLPAAQRVAQLRALAP